MKYLKTFESIDEFRDVNISELYDDYVKYRKNIIDDNSKFKIYHSKDISGYGYQSILADEFTSLLINPMILNKNIKFSRFKDILATKYSKMKGDGSNIYDYHYEGKVIDINTNLTNNTFDIIVTLDNYLCLSLIQIDIKKYTFYKPEKIQKSSDIIRIFDSVETEIEDKINMIKSSDKYNI